MLIAILRTEHPKLLDVIAHLAHHGFESYPAHVLPPERLCAADHAGFTDLVVHGVETHADASRLRSHGAIFLRVVVMEESPLPPPHRHLLQADYPLYVSADTPVAPEVDALLRHLGYLDPLPGSRNFPTND
ncbi:MAG: hypothetical protein B7Z66_14445 [Chromatiales bacterium 21-64-14]|nr:MAG: hypothetical protein B7Z66_14445 [Chromatiales bacterium 21-64-14]